MRVHVFENAIEPDLYGFSSDRDGNNLLLKGGNGSTSKRLIWR